jgi:cytochrome c oxidase assembly protein subunit 15
MPVQPLYDLSPLARLLVMGVLLASGPLLLVYLRSRKHAPLGRVHALAVVTLFLTFDLVLFGAFTRLTDSGLGCPDWPGCYGNASPLGASAEIASAQRVLPSGPVTPGKAWVEMVHRYLAMAVGVLITVLAVVAWLRRRVPGATSRVPTVWASVTLVWVCVQGAFGALTVTMKLFPAVVTLHLLGGYALMALLAVQVALRSNQQSRRTAVSVALRAGMAGALALLLLQAASGAWVSSNYAVLACSEFPLCQGSWWPLMDFAQGFQIWRPLGLNQDGSNISFQALTAMHFFHRTLAMLTLAVLGTAAVRLSQYASVRRFALWLGALMALQVFTGVSNVLLGWPLLSAVVHTGGAGALVVVLTWLLASTYSPNVSAATQAFAGPLSE